MPLSQDLFHALIRDENAAVRHDALLSLVTIARTCPKTEGLRDLFPQGMLTRPASGEPTDLGRLYMSYLKGSCSLQESELNAVLDSSELRAEGKALARLAGIISGSCPGGIKGSEENADGRGGRKLLMVPMTEIVSVIAADARLWRENNQRQEQLNQQQQQLNQQQHIGSSGGDQPSALMKLLPQNKARLAAASAALSDLETSLRNLKGAACAGGALSREGAPLREVRAQLFSHTSQVLAELTSLGSRVKTMVGMMEVMREG